MKKALLILLVFFSINNYSNKEVDYNYNHMVNVDNKSINFEANNTVKRDYNYFYYSNNDNYFIRNQNDIKNALYNGLNNGKDTVTLYCEYSNNEYCLSDFYTVYKNKDLMSSINNYVSPFNKYKNTKYRINMNNDEVVISIDIEKKYSFEEINKINTKLDYYLSKLDLNNMSDADKIKWAHDLIVNNNIYDEEAEKSGFKESYSAYGTFINNKAICKGYSEAMAILLDRFNIPNIMISSGVHVWNLVKVNGEWLHLDTTWDDPVYADGSQNIIYDYYLITSKKIHSLDKSKSHKFDSNLYLEASM